jgi:hypothetical protein
MNEKCVNYSNQIISWSMHSWSIFDAWMNHGHTQTHKIHHSPNLGEATTFLFIIFLIGHKGPHPNVILSRDSQVESLKVFKIGIPSTLERHNFLCRPSTEMRSEEKL